MDKIILEVKNLKVEIENKIILDKINLSIKPGEIHAIAGANGSGKTSLALTIMGHPKYNVISGDILFSQESVIDLPTHERSLKGIYMAFQAPIVIPGVSNIQFLKAMINSKAKAQNLPQMDTMDLLNEVKSRADELQLPKDYIERSVNEGFSGGEKKRNEILQLLMLDPTIAILDETDSGLDAQGITMLIQIIKSQQAKGRSFLIITHYSHFLDKLSPTYLHTMNAGQIVHSTDYGSAYHSNKEHD